MLRLALTKGRLEKKMLEILSDIGLDVSELYTGSRKLIYTIPGESLELMLAKAADVVTYVALRRVRHGVVGKDTIWSTALPFTR